MSNEAISLSRRTHVPVASAANRIDRTQRESNGFTMNDGVAGLYMFHPGDD
jgi:translation initiation factor IF-2